VAFDHVYYGGNTMAEEIFDQNYIFNRALKESKGNIFKKARNGSSFGDHKPLSSDEQYKRNKCIEIITNADKSNFSADFEILDLWDKDVLNTLTTKQLVKLSELMSSMTRIANETKRVAGNATLVSAGIYDNLKEALELCEQAIIDTSGNFLKMGEIDQFTSDKIQGVLDSIDKGEFANEGSFFVASDADLELVAALKLCGVNLEAQEIDRNGVKFRQWKLPDDYKNEFAMTTADGQSFTFEREQVEGLLQNYLNVLETDRKGKVITADGLLKVFMQTAERSMADKNNSTLVKEQIKLAIATQEKIYNANSDEFKLALMIEENSIMKLAQKQSLINVYNQQLEKIKEEELFSGFSEELDESLNDNKILSSKEERLRKKLYKLESLAENAQDFIVSNLDNKNKTNYYDEYSNLLGRLNARKNEPGMMDKINALKNARDLFQANVSFQEEYIRQEIGDGVVASEDVISASKQASHFKVERQNSGVLNLVDMGNTNEKAQSVMDILRERVQKSNMAEAPIQPTMNGVEIEVLPNIFMEYSNVIADFDVLGQNYIDSLNGIMNEGMAGYLFRPGQLLDRAYNEFINKPENKGKTFDDFIQKYTNTAPESMFDAESLKAGFVLNHPDKADEIGVDAKKSENINKSFKNHLLLLDLATQGLTAEEVSKYLDPSYPEESRYKMIEAKIKDANNLVSKMNTSDYAKAVTIAEKRLKNGVMKQYLSAYMPKVIEAEGEVGTGSHLTDALHGYVQELGKVQDKNNEALLANGEKIVDLNKKLEFDKEKVEQSEEENKSKPLKYKDLYPSAPSTEKFLKKMKPYYGKNIVKFFIEPLLDDIENKEINMDEYNRNKKAVQYQPKKESSENKAENKNPENEGNQEEEEQEAETEEQKEKIVPTQPEPRTPENSPIQPQKKAPVAIKQRTFEAGTFMPGYFMLEKLQHEDAFKQDPLIQKLKDTIGYMCSTDGLMNSEQFCQKNSSGKDFRDDMRQIALNICGGKYKDNPAQIKADLDVSATKYGIALDDPKFVDVKTSFDLITPEFLNFVFAPSSEYNQQSGTIKIGANLPIEELSQTTSDRERRNVMSNFYLRESFKPNRRDDAEALRMLIFDIYRENKSVKTEEIKKAFETHTLTDAEYANIEEILKEDNGMDM